MKILVVGKGGREHALVWKLAQSDKVDKIYAAPGNIGINRIAQNVPIDSEDLHGLAKFAKDNKIDLTVVGPEVPFTMGIVDIFEENGLKIFGPNKEAAEIEGSKAFAKYFMEKHHIPTARFKVFDNHFHALDFIKSCNYPLVIKADGLAAGKGAVIVENSEQATKTIEEIMVDKVFGEAGSKLIIEEFLVGEEVTVMAFTDGERVVPMIPSQDHKRIGEGDTGLNTGGMGAYAPTRIISESMLEQITEEILEPTIRGLAAQGRKYMGVLYTGIIITERGPKVLEYNCRFGDPETQAVLPLLDSDLVQIFLDILDGYLDKDEVKWKEESCVCVVLASKGYPAATEKGAQIKGLDECESDGCMIFHAGTGMKDGKYVTDGGRVLGIAMRGHTMKDALSKTYEFVDRVKFDGMQYRGDIGWRSGNIDKNYF